MNFASFTIPKMPKTTRRERKGGTEGEGTESEWGKRGSAKINLQYLISLFDLHLSHGAAASNQGSVNIQRVAFYHLRLYILFYLILKYYVHTRLGDIKGGKEDDRRVWRKKGGVSG